MFIIVITKTFIDNLWPRRHCENIWVIQNYEGISLKYQRRIYFSRLIFLYISSFVSRVSRDFFITFTSHEIVLSHNFYRFSPPPSRFVSHSHHIVPVFLTSFSPFSLSTAQKKFICHTILFSDIYSNFSRD